MELMNSSTPVRFRKAATMLNRALIGLTLVKDLVDAIVVQEDPNGLLNEMFGGYTRPVADPANAAGANELKKLVDCIHKLRWASEAVVTAEDAMTFFAEAHKRALEEENVDLPF